MPPLIEKLPLSAYLGTGITTLFYQNYKKCSTDGAVFFIFMLLNR